MTEDDLLDRLAKEAAQRGRAEIERDHAMSVVDKATREIERLRDVLRKTELLLKATAENAMDARKEAHESRNREQQSEIVLNNLIESARDYAIGRRRRRTALHTMRAAIDAARKYVEIPF